MKLLGLIGTRPTSPGPVHPGDVLAETEALHVRLGGREVLSGVDVTARAGEVLALVGPNGAGKSTLLGALAADLPAAEGVVRVHGRPASDWSAQELALRRAVLPQSAALSFPFAVEEVVRMGRAPWAGRPEEDEDEAAVAAAMAATEVSTSRAGPSRRSAAASGPGWRSPGCSPSAPGCCCSTNRPPPWTCATRNWCSGSAAQGRTPGTRWSWCCTIWGSRRPMRTGS